MPEKSLGEVVLGAVKESLTAYFDTQQPKTDEKDGKITVSNDISTLKKHITDLEVEKTRLRERLDVAIEKNLALTRPNQEHSGGQTLESAVGVAVFLLEHPIGDQTKTWLPAMSVDDRIASLESLVADLQAQQVADTEQIAKLRRYSGLDLH